VILGDQAISECSHICRKNFRISLAIVKVIYKVMHMINHEGALDYFSMASVNHMANAHTNTFLWPSGNYLISLWLINSC